MAEREAPFRKAVESLKIDTTPDPAHRRKLRQEMLVAYHEAARQRSGRATASGARIVRFGAGPWLKLAAAAVIVVAVLFGIVDRIGRRDTIAIAVAKVREASEQQTWMHLTITQTDAGQEYVEEHWYYAPLHKTFGVSPSGTVWCLDYGAGQREFSYKPSARTITVSHLPRDGLLGIQSAYNLVAMFEALEQDAATTIERQIDEGNGRRVYRCTMRDPIPRPDARSTGISSMVVTLVVDGATDLIVDGGVRFLNAARAVVSAWHWRIDYPQSGPRSLYDLGVPRTARIVDATVRPIGTPGYVPTPAPGPANGAQMIPIHVELPRAVFVGTPLNYRVPYMKKPLGRPRPPFIAPVGTHNVARGKPVLASDPEPIVGEPEWITDGDKEASEGSYVELGPGLQHVTIDLQRRCEIYAIVLWHYHKDPRTYFDVVVQLADDPAFKTGVRTVFNNDLDGSAGLGKGGDLHYTETHEGNLIDTKGQSGRYVRLHSNGNTSDSANHYIEVEVYGKEVD